MRFTVYVKPKYILYLAWILFCTATVVQIERPGAFDYLDTSHVGVDVQHCSRIVFQVRSCSDANVQLRERSSGRYQNIIIGGWENTKSSFEPCASCERQVFPSNQIFSCTDFRHVWMQWSRAFVVLGRGSTIGVNVIFNATRLDSYEIDMLRISGYPSSPAIFKFGVERKSMYQLVSAHGRFTSGRIRETTAAFTECANDCHEDADCGMFSYGREQHNCEMFKRTFSSYPVERAEEWKSWKMMFCFR